jgi:glycerol-1-phosphate dehydrogenase [NAD(P)+]
MDIPWNLVKDQISKPPVQVINVPNVHLSTLNSLAEQLPKDVEMVMGVGGGSSHDCAKYLALKTGARLVQFPTIFGGDAVITTAVGVRKESKVTYIGYVELDRMFVDFDVIRKAPPQLVRYGAADILSSYTGLLDWRLAADRGKERFDEQRAAYAKNVLLGRLRQQADAIRRLTDDGIKTIVELFAEYHKLAHQLDTDRPQEGSEHFIAYNAEYVTGRTFVHGTLLALGIWISGGFFHNRKQEVGEFLDALGLDYRLGSSSLSERELETTLETLKEFLNGSDYYYSIVDELDITPTLIAEILASVRQ